MKKVRIAAASAVFLAMLLASMGTAEAGGRSNWVSGFTVLSAPEKYAGRTVAMLGWLANEREGFVLYLTPWHREFQSAENAFLLVTADEHLRKEALRLGEKAVLVEGTFREAPEDDAPKVGGRITDLKLLAEAHSIHAEERAARKNAKGVKPR